MTLSRFNKSRLEEILTIRPGIETVFLFVTHDFQNL